MPAAQHHKVPEMNVVVSQISIKITPSPTFAVTFRAANLGAVHSRLPRYNIGGVLLQHAPDPRFRQTKLPSNGHVGWPGGLLGQIPHLGSEGHPVDILLRSHDKNYVKRRGTHAETQTTRVWGIWMHKTSAGRPFRPPLRYFTKKFSGGVAHTYRPLPRAYLSYKVYFL